MAKKSLKKRIDDLVDALGGAEKPTLAQIRSDLVSIGTFAQELEDGQALAENETTIAALKQENENLKVELQMANGELKLFRAAVKKQKEEKEREIPPIQFEILRVLPSEHGGSWLKLPTIAHAVKIPIDEAEVHKDALEKLGLIIFHPHEPGGGGWLRTAEGNKLVVAKRLAGEEAPTPDKRAETDSGLLSAIEEKILLFLDPISSRRVDYGGHGVSSVAKHINTGKTLVEGILEKLQTAQLIDMVPIPKFISGGEQGWGRTDAGDAYLAKHGLLQ